MGRVHSNAANLGQRDRANCPAATHVVKHTTGQTDGVHVINGRVACELTPGLYGESGWWVVLEKAASV